MDNEKTERPWDPCEDCLRPLAVKFREWSHDDSRIDKLRHPAIVEGWYRDYATVVCRRWLEFYVSPEYADRFQAHLDGPLDRLRAWQKRCDLGAFNDMDDVGDEYESICCDVAKSAEFMYQLDLMIDSRVEPKTHNGKPTGTPRPTKRPPIERRDEWLYNECCKGTLLKTIVNRLKNQPKTWPRISSIQGVKNAANRYAKTHNLPAIPSRQSGRPSKRKK